MVVIYLQFGSKGNMFKKLNLVVSSYDNRRDAQ